MPKFFQRGVITLFILLVGLFFEVAAQSKSNLNWYFGNSDNIIRFVLPNYTAELDSIPNNLNIGQSGVATDPVTGGIMFYTDGTTVYDATHGVMLNGAGIGGNGNLNQGVAVCNDPGNPDRYFIFTITATGALQYAEVDMTGNRTFPAPPLGEVISTNNTTGLPTSARSEAMIILSNSNEDGFWVITHENGTTNYDISQIDNTGTITTSTQNIAGAPTNVANFSFNESTNQIAVSPKTVAEELTIMTFDRATGTLTFSATVPGTNVSTLPSDNIYDTEWSNNGRYLYISGNFGGVTDELMQIDFTEAPTVLRPLLSQNISRSFGLQMAPDSTIYHVYRHTNGTFRVGRINNPDTVVNQTLYAPRPFGNTNFQGRQFPAFLPDFDPMLQVNFTVSGNCANALTFFFPDVTPDVDSVFWDFGDGNGSNQLSAFNTYTAAGAYNVRLFAFLNGQVDSAVQVVNIQDFDLQITGIPQSDTVCAEDFPVTYTAQASGASAGSAVFQWSNQTSPGATTQIDSAGSYYVVASANGCETYAPLQVVEYGAIEQQAFIWYFGNHAGLDFNPLFDINNPGPVAPIDYGDPAYNGGNEMIAPEGCAIYGDDNGTVLFYAEGDTIYDRQNNVIATGIGGDVGSTQSIFIIPVPGDATLWYVFLSQQIYDQSGNDEYEFRYVMFDLKERGGLGDLKRDGTGNVITTTLFCGNTERITGNNNWVIVHEYGNNNFRAYPVTGNGIGTPVISNVGLAHPTSSETAGQGYMKLSNNGRLAVALTISNSEKYIETFDFTDSSGVVSNPHRIEVLPNGRLYGLEFSQAETNIFVSLINSNTGFSDIWFWEIDSLNTNPSFNDTTLYSITSGIPGQLGALQLGPDGSIYVAKNGAPALSTITNTDGKMSNPNIGAPVFNDDAQPLGANLVEGGSTLSSLGLPNFSNLNVTTPTNISISTSNGCEGDQLTFTVTNPISLETYRWNILDSNNNVITSGTGTSFTFVLSQAGTYTARVDVIPQCQIVDNPPGSGQAQFSIFANPSFTIDQVQDVTGACGNANGSFRVNFTETGTYTYTVTGPVPTPTDTVTAQPFTVSNLSAGGYSVTITNTSTGCSSSQTTSISDPATFDITPTPTTADCTGANGNINVLITGTPPAYPVTYTITNEANNSITASGTDFNTDGDSMFDVPINSGTYTVLVTESGANGCVVSRSGITVATPPAATLTLPTEFVACDVTEARVPFSTNATGLSVSGPAVPTIEGDSILIITVEGTYTITAVGDNVNTCDVIQNLSVVFNNSDPNPFEPRYIICPREGLPFDERAVLFENPPSGFLFARWFDENDNEITGDVPNLYQFTADSLIVLDDVNIRVELTNAFGCITNAEIEIVEDCKARVNAPNAFKPTSAILSNQTWRVFPVLVSPDDFHIFIFNRWGEMVFQSNDLNFMAMDGGGWNGGYDNDPGRPLPGGTYAYKVIFKNITKDDAEPQERRGGITIIR